MNPDVSSLEPKNPTPNLFSQGFVKRYVGTPTTHKNYKAGQIQPKIQRGVPLPSPNLQGITQAHHVIPHTLARDEIWAKAGMNINDRINLMALPSKEGKRKLDALGIECNRSVHDGFGLHNHVIREMRTEINRIKDEGERLGYTQPDYKRELTAVIQRERRLLRSGERKLIQPRNISSLNNFSTPVKGFIFAVALGVGMSFPAQKAQAGFSSNIARAHSVVRPSVVSQKAFSATPLPSSTYSAVSKAAVSQLVRHSSHSASSATFPIHRVSSTNSSNRKMDGIPAARSSPAATSSSGSTSRPASVAHSNATAQRPKTHAATSHSSGYHVAQSQAEHKAGVHSAPQAPAKASHSQSYTVSTQRMQQQPRFSVVRPAFSQIRNITTQVRPASVANVSKPQINNQTRQPQSSQAQRQQTTDQVRRQQQATEQARRQQQQQQEQARRQQQQRAAEQARRQQQQQEQARRQQQQQEQARRQQQQQEQARRQQQQQEQARRQQQQQEQARRQQQQQEQARRQQQQQEQARRQQQQEQARRQQQQQEQARRQQQQEQARRQQQQEQARRQQQQQQQQAQFSRGRR